MAVTEYAGASHKPQTIKQARANYKARGAPTVSEREQKQINRAAELERRATRFRESDKRRADLDRKRLVKERENKAQAARLLGSQRQTDRFGYMSSQFHLGAFFGAGAKETDQSAATEVDRKEEFTNEDGFGDGDIDDVVLLAVLDVEEDGSGEEMVVEVVVDKQDTSDVKEQDLNAFWDDLDTSTQIARELSPCSIQKQDVEAKSMSSFGSSDLDISVDEFEALEQIGTHTTDVSRCGVATTTDHTTLQCSIPSRVVSRDCDEVRDRKAMPPPPALARKGLPSFPRQVFAKPWPAMRSGRGPVRAHTTASCGFSVSELESFVDDDLQLTQIELG